jgi:hypothetical protein
MGCFDRATRLDSAHRLEQLGRLDLADWQRAKPREYILLKPDESASGMACAHVGEVNRRMPFAPHGLEAVDHDLRPARLLGAACLAGVDTVGQQGSRPVPFLSRCLQRRVRICAHRQQLFLAPKAVLQPPPAAAIGGNFQIEPSLVVEANRFLGRLRGADLRVAEHGEPLGVTAFCA